MLYLKYQMKLILSLILFLLMSSTRAQNLISGLVKDLKTKEPLPWCAIGIKHSAKGGISNVNGEFSLPSVFSTDTIIVVLTGYKQKTITVSDFVKTSVIYLEQKENRLAEIVVYSSDEFLYDAFEKCRNTLLLSQETKSKAYFVLESELGGQPSELLECYYNAHYNNSSLHALDFKNGRVGLAPYDGRYFINMNTSRAISTIDLCRTKDRFPDIPFQYNKRKLKKAFFLKLVSVYDSLNPVYQIEFTPRLSDGKAFSGQAWIEKNSGRLKKITLSIKETQHHPFLPVFKDFGQIENVSMEIQKIFTEEDGITRPSHLHFNYRIAYRHLHNATAINANRDTTFVSESRGLMRFYDDNNLFYIPHFVYEQELSDYRKITSLTYNEGFWDNSQGLVYSDRMKQAVTYFRKNGLLINYKTNKASSLYHDKIFENNYIVWSGKLRLSMKKDGIKNDTLHAVNAPLATAYQLKAQLYFDLNPCGDSLQHFSCTVFDVYNTWYNIKEEPVTNCFLNIYFDLFEIERRKMEKRMSAKKNNADELDLIYREAAASAETLGNTYLKEVERGKKLVALRKWNEVVKQELGIDNMDMFQIR